MTGERLDLRTNTGVPETDGTVLSARQNVFCAPLSVSHDVNGPFVTCKGLVQTAGERLGTSGWSHGGFLFWVVRVTNVLWQTSPLVSAALVIFETSRDRERAGK